MHPVNAVGIGLAVNDAILLTEALSSAWADEQPLEDALAGYHQARDARTEPMFRASLEAARATGSRIAPERLGFWAALSRLPQDADSVINGLARSPEEIAEIMARAASN